MDEQSKVRFDKLEGYRKEGFSHPNNVSKSHSSLEVEELASSGDTESECSVAGRIVAVRMMGKAAFIKVKDMQSTLQVYVRKDRVGDDSYAKFKTFDIGDIVEISGNPFLTKTEEPSLKANSIRLLVKCLHPLPEKWHGLSDVEVRYRKRYLDLIVNEDSFNVFILRSKIIQKTREFFTAKGYVEVETQMMNPVVSGAAAKPFETHHNALNLDLNLRIALELPLKKMLVGGIDRVFEIGRVFRNEGISTEHNPEFTMIEFYQAYSTYEDLMDLSEELLLMICDDVIKRREIEFGDQLISFEGPWKRITMIDSIYEYAKVDRSEDLRSLAGVKKVAKDLGLEQIEEINDYGKALSTIFEERVEEHLINPTFITQFPLSVSPLSRKNQEDPEFVDRFELYVAGMELANAFSELNDAEDQLARFQDQIKQKSEGDEEAMSLDSDFIEALEYGMPPTAGEGIGIDRLVMLLTGSQSIRDVILFPQMKPVTTSDE